MLGVGQIGSTCTSTHEVTAQVCEAVAHIGKHRSLAAVYPLILHRSAPNVLEFANPLMHTPGHCQDTQACVKVWKERKVSCNQLHLPARLPGLCDQPVVSTGEGRGKRVTQLALLGVLVTNDA
eukprot:scaffold197561_cov24-Tisochrysis_lutea.AAC.3